VPLVINQEAGTPFAIRIANHTLPSDINVYVEDVVEKTVTLVTAQSFELTPQTKLSGIGRFYLHFTRSSLSVESIVNTSLITAYKGNGNDYISIEGLQLFSKASKIILYNLLGVKIIDTTLNTPSQKEMISTAGIKQGVYILEINYDNQVLIKKIVI
ncbi:T9SS type A sorting domain-containing protein, partial [Polaribacter sp. BAL334]|uniref:T9SS type A sorting domain-containing protein n=1 Tax=Polaribacter sp. BAL334 TaxID=1708178 RepID=UPI0018D20B90